MGDDPRSDGVRRQARPGMTLPTLIATACACATETREDPARICAACLVLARLQEFLEAVYIYDGERVSYRTDRGSVPSQAKALLEAYEALAGTTKPGRRWEPAGGEEGR